MNFFDYFQIVTMAFVACVLFGRALSLHLIAHVNPIVIGGGKHGLGLVMEWMAVIGLVAWLTIVLLNAFHAHLPIFSTILEFRLVDSFTARYAGVALVTLGLILFGLAFISFGDSWRVGLDVRTPGPLVTSGVFAISRNPIYGFLNLWFLGIFLINGNLIFLIFAMMAVVFLHWQILQEEKFLLQLYGRPYQTYCEQTGRYLLWM